MRGLFKVMLIALSVASCSKVGMSLDNGINYDYGKNIPHDQIELGERLENPYTTSNITKALESLDPTKADRV